MIFGSMPRPNNDGPELRDAAGAEPAAATSENETLIPLPGAGETIIVNLHGLTSAQFAFDPDIAQATVRGDDLVLSINGGAIVLVGYVEALRAGDLPTLVSPLGDEIFPDSLLNRPGGQDPDQPANSSFVEPESSGGFAPLQEATPLGTTGLPSGALAATSLTYATAPAPDELEPLPIRPPSPPVANDDSAVTDEDTPV